MARQERKLATSLRARMDKKEIPIIMPPKPVRSLCSPNPASQQPCPKRRGSDKHRLTVKKLRICDFFNRILTKYFLSTNKTL